MHSIPSKGRSYSDVLEEMESFRQKDVNYHEGRTWSLVYHLNNEHTDFLKQAHGLYFSENALNPMAFQSLKRFEHEVIRMTADLLHGDRELAKRKKRFGSFTPEMIAPESIHVAWEKGAKYFGVKMVSIPLQENYQVDLNTLKKKINRNTIMIVASAPSYPHGVIDPIEELGQIAVNHKIPFHVDSCLGGFMLPFIEMEGYKVTPFDFRVSGVTSISADVHKYGFAAKGASTVLYRNMDYLKHQFFIHQDWPGGVFASPALLGTRPGGSIAAAWAALNAIGMDGYRKIAGTIMETTKILIDGINGIEGLKVMGKPAMSVFAFTSTDRKVNIFAVGDQMEERGWHVDRLQRPEGLHAMVTPAHQQVTEKYLEDLKASVEIVRLEPKLGYKGNAAMYLSGS